VSLSTRYLSRGVEGKANLEGLPEEGGEVFEIEGAGSPGFKDQQGKVF